VSGSRACGGVIVGLLFTFGEEMSLMQIPYRSQVVGSTPKDIVERTVRTNTRGE
jgi:hypothetical protein